MFRNTGCLRFTMTMLLLALPGLHPKLRASASDMLDQSQTERTSQLTSTGDYISLGPGFLRGQIFTAGLSGYLDRVSVYVANNKDYPSTVPITVSIQTVSGGLPSGTEIGFGMVPTSALAADGSFGWVDANIDGAYVIAGTQYALVLSLGPLGRSYGEAFSGLALSDIYSGGYEVFSDTFEGAWGTWPSFDQMFKTYVIPDTLDQSEPAVSLSSTPLGSTPVGQTFTVGLRGLVDRVNVYLTNSAANPAPITITILNVTAQGLPSTGTQVASGTIPAGAIPYSGWVTARISTLVVTPGTKYALLLQTNVTGPRWVYVNDVYSGGAQVIKSGTSWAAKPNDFAFQTYVMQPVLDQSQTTWTTPSHVGNAQTQSQAFTAQLSGILDRVSVVLSRPGCWECDYAHDDVTVNLYAVPGLLLGSGTIPFSWLPPWQTPGWLDASFSGVSVIAGGVYSMTLIEPSSVGVIEWYMNLHPYPGTFTYKTFVIPLPSSTTMTSPGGITPCSNGVCPSASGGFTPADLTDGVTSHFQFQERPNGTFQGILNFSDPRTGGIVLRGCTTESAACALTVTTFSCADTHSMEIGGSYTLLGGAATVYWITLSGASNGPGTFQLYAGGKTFTITLDGVADVSCPPMAAPFRAEY